VESHGQQEADGTSEKLYEVLRRLAALEDELRRERR
jgi:hypothetical protein